MKKKNQNVKKLLICGLGSIGKKHLKIIRKNWPKIKVGALRSRKLEFYKNTLEEGDNTCKYFFNLDDAINWDPDCVIISNPANLHLQYALVFANQGKHIFIEKPIGIGNESLDEWEKLIGFNNRIKILIGYVFRHDYGINKIKQQLANIGQLIEADFYCGSWLPDWRGGENMGYAKGVSAISKLGGGALLELSHEVDMAYWLLGSLKIKYAFLNKSDILEIDVEDYAIIHALGPENCSVTIRLNFCTNEENRTINLKGSRGSLNYDLINGILITKIDGNIKEIKSKDFSKEDKYFKQINHFIECVEYDKNPVCNIYDGLQVLEYIKVSKEINTNTYL